MSTFRPIARAAISRRRGMTLLETLLAMAMAALVAALVYSLYHAVVSTRRAQQALRGPEAAAQALQRLARDLECAWAAVPDTACLFTLTADADGDSQVGFCTAVLPEGETDLRWAEIHRVSYRLVPAAAGRALAREHLPLAGPGASASPVTNALAPGISRFRVLVLDGTEWRSEWTGGGGASCPSAARVELRCGSRDLEADVFIPAGNAITSSLTRAAAPVEGTAETAAAP